MSLGEQTGGKSLTLLTEILPLGLADQGQEFAALRSAQHNTLE